MRGTKTILSLWLLFAAAACGGDDDDRDPPEPPAEPPPPTATIAPYTPCEADSDCGDLSCVTVVGAKVCVQIGCAGDESACPEGTTCTVSAAVAPTGMCALTGANTFCARECSDVLECNLKPECATEGCCNDLDEAGCPTQCGELDPMTCEISPQCPAACCVH